MTTDYEIMKTEINRLHKVCRSKNNLLILVRDYLISSIESEKTQEQTQAMIRIINDYLE